MNIIKTRLCVQLCKNLFHKYQKFILLISIFSYDGLNWEETSLPQYKYDYDAANMVLYNGKPVMIGAYEEKKLQEFQPDNISLWRSNASYFEVFDPATEKWSDLKRNPFFPELAKSYWHGASVTKEDSFLIFGGRFRVYNGKNSYTIQF